MSELKLLPFRRKRRCKASKKSLFPIPLRDNIGHEVQDSEWPMYFGVLVGKTVKVNNPQHIEALQQGFYGNSNIPRRRPKNVRSVKLAVAESLEIKENDEINNVSGEPSSSEMMEVHDASEEPSSAEISEINENEEMTEVEKTLMLSLEEAFFLSLGLGCLTVIKDEKQFNLEELYSVFDSLDSHFKHRYVVYHYYRSLGWIVKSGLKFGVDYILYKDGPPFYHASYSVLMIIGDKDEQQINLTWASLAGLNRLCERVAKELILSYVYESEQLNVLDKQLTDTVFRFQLSNQLIRRWVPNEERQDEVE